MDQRGIVDSDIHRPSGIVYGDSGGLRIEIARSLDELETHADAWNSLALKSPHRLPMLSYAWVASYIEYRLEPGESWFCLFAYDESRLVGVLPVAVKTRNFMGLKRLKLRTFYRVDFLAELGWEKEVIPLFLSYISRMCPAYYRLKVDHLPESSPLLSVLVNGVKGVISVCDFDGYGSFVRVEGNYEELKARLPASFKRNLRRLGRKLSTLKEVKISFLDGKSPTEKELTRLMEVESSGWKREQGTSIIQSDPHVSFYKALTRKLADLGWLEWHFLEADGKTLAAHLAMRVDRSLVLYKIGFDEAYSSYSPGTVLFDRMVERTFASGEFDEINCLSDHAWNRRWGMEKRIHYNVYLFPRRPLAILFGALPLRIRNTGRRIPGICLLYHSLASLFKRLRN